MYSTVIKQQHMIDRTEQERLLLSFITQKYYKNERIQYNPVRRMMRLKTKRTHSTQAVQPSESA